MDRRQRKTREAIFCAFSELLSKKHYSKITVEEIITRADIGRATFYAHFETKDYLLKELCEELFCHIFDATEGGKSEHRHIFKCDAQSSVFLHLLQHLKKNDASILDLLAGESNDIFLLYFKKSLGELVKKQPSLFSKRKPEGLPEDFWCNFISSSFVEAVKWWVEGGMKESPEAMAEYLSEVI